MKNKRIIRKLEQLSQQLRIEMDNLDDIVASIDELAEMIGEEDDEEQKIGFDLE